MSFLSTSMYKLGVFVYLFSISANFPLNLRFKHFSNTTLKSTALEPTALKWALSSKSKTILSCESILKAQPQV